jgi:hypothetical protein
MSLTNNDYIKAIKLHLKTAKQGEYSSYLLESKRKGLRDLCELLLEKKLSKTDENSFRQFFQITNEDDDLKRAIQRFDTDKFRAIQNFIDGKNENTSNINIELIAVLTNFQPRPLKNFLANGTTQIEKTEENTFSEVTKNTNSYFSEEKGKSKSIYWILGLTGLFITSYFTKEIIFPEKQCMVWKEDHYEEVDCENEVNSFYNLSKEVKNKEALSLKKIDVCDTTTFFVNGKPVVWYGKNHGNHDFFNQDGTHPITGKDLKPVTDYIIKKHVKPCK